MSFTGRILTGKKGAVRIFFEGLQPHQSKSPHRSGHFFRFGLYRVYDTFLKMKGHFCQHGGEGVGSGEFKKLVGLWASKYLPVFLPVIF